MSIVKEKVKERRKRKMRKKEEKRKKKIKERNRRKEEEEMSYLCNSPNGCSVRIRFLIEIFTSFFR